MNESYTLVANKTSINGYFQLSHRKKNTKNKTNSTIYD